MKQKKQKFLASHFFSGFLLGIIFLFIATIIDSYQTFDKFELKTILFFQEKSNLYMFLNLLPLVFGGIGYYIAQLKLELEHKEQEIKNVKEIYKTKSAETEKEVLPNDEKVKKDENSSLYRFTIDMLEKELNLLLENKVQNKAYSFPKELRSIYNLLSEIKKLQAKKKAEEHSEFIIDDLVDGILACYPNSYISNFKGLDIFIFMDKKLNYTLVGNFDFIIKVIYCFLENTLQETSKGPIILAIKELKVFSYNQVTLELQVENQGIGTINTRNLESYNYFYNLESNISINRYSLPIYFQASKMYHATINIQSELGKGSSYNLQIDLSKNTNSPVSNKINLKNKVILIFGNNETENEVLEEYCAYLELKVTSYLTVNTHYLENDDFDLVLITNRKTYKEFQNINIKNSHYKVIVLCENLESTKKLTNHIYIEKPMTRNKLGYILLKALQNETLNIIENNNNLELADISNELAFLVKKKENLIDRTIIETLSEIDDKSLLKELIEDFIENEILIENIFVFFEVQDLKNLLVNLKKLKSPAINLGAIAIVNLCDKIEDEIKQDNIEELEFIIKDLKDTFKKTCIELKKF